MVKFFSAVVLGSVFALAGCVADVDSSPEEGDEGVGADEQVASAEQPATLGAINAAFAYSLTLRSSAGGTTIGTMYTDPSYGVSKFYVHSTSGSWSYGYSYSLGKWGYAMTYYLTTSYSESGTPGQFGYQYGCWRSDGTGMAGGVG